MLNFLLNDVKIHLQFFSYSFFYSKEISVMHSIKYILKSSSGFRQINVICFVSEGLVLKPNWDMNVPQEELF